MNMHETGQVENRKDNVADNKLSALLTPELSQHAPPSHQESQVINAEMARLGLIPNVQLHHKHGPQDNKQNHKKDASTDPTSTSTDSPIHLPQVVIDVAQRKALIDQALTLAHEKINTSTENAVDIIITHESDWDPNAINLWDSNAKAGHPSKGLMQTIQSTFDQFALPGHNTNIYDPLSNMIAGIRYADATYNGSVNNVPGVVAIRHGRPYVGY